MRTFLAVLFTLAVAPQTVLADQRFGLELDAVGLDRRVSNPGPGFTLGLAAPAASRLAGCSAPQPGRLANEPESSPDEGTDFCSQALVGWDGTPGGRFGLVASPLVPPPPDQEAPPESGVSLTLFSTSRDRTSLVDELTEELDAHPWLAKRSRLQEHMDSEQKRLLASGLIGSADSMGMLIDVLATVRLLRRWWRGLQGRKRPLGARIPYEEELDLIVREADGSFPAEISVLPLVLGYVGETIQANCDSTGRCRVTSLPSEPCTLLVRGRGAGLLRVSVFGVDSMVVLAPIGVLQIPPSRGEDQSALQVQLRHQASGLVVPVNRWQNPGRGEWVAIPGGLSLFLPAGTYAVTGETAGGREWQTSAKVEPDTTAAVTIPR